VDTISDLYDQRNGEEDEPMKSNHKPALAMFNHWRVKGGFVFGTALVSFTAGSFITAHLMNMSRVMSGR
jgi:hypothetical protein